MTDIHKQIIRIILDHPGIKARDISKRLNVPRGKINIELFGSLKGYCYQNTDYGWLLRENAAELLEERKPLENISEPEPPSEVSEKESDCQPPEKAKNCHSTAENDLQRSFESWCQSEGHSIQDIENLNVVSNFIKKHKTNDSIYELATLSSVEKTRAELLRDKVFHSVNFDYHFDLIPAIDLYRSFLKEECDGNQSQIKSNSITEPTNIESTDDNQASLKENHPENLDISLSESAQFVDFEQPRLYEGMRPIRCIINWIPIHGSTWPALLCNIVEYLLKSKPSTMKDLYSHSLSMSPFQSPFLLKNKVRGFNCVQLSNGYWVNVNYSTSYLVEAIGKLCVHCGIDLTKVIIKCERESSNYAASTEAGKSSYQKIATPQINLTVESDLAKNQSHKSDDPPDVSMQICEHAITSTNCALNTNKIDDLLSNAEFDLLRDALTKQNITTIDDLKAIKLWPFMNRLNLYSIGTRQKIYNEVQALLYPPTIAPGAELYNMQFGSTSYKGASPSEAYLHFCEDIACRYPLRFRNLIGLRTQNNGPIALSKKGEAGYCLKMENPATYVRADLSVEDVLRNAKWICNVCGEGNPSLTLDVIRPIENSTSEYLPSPALGSEPDMSSAPVAVRKPNQAPASVCDFKAEPQALPIEHNPVSASRTQDRSVNDPMIQRLESIVLRTDLDGITEDGLNDKTHIGLSATKQLVAQDMQIVNIKGRLIHENAFIDWDEGAACMEDILEKLMQKNDGYVSAAQLYEYARVDMNMFLNDNDMNDERSVYDFAYHLFHKASYHGISYQFAGNIHISRSSDAVLTNLDVIQKYVSDQGGVFAFKDLEAHLLGLGIKVGNLRTQMKINYAPVFFYYEDGVLISAESLGVGPTWKTAIARALAKLFSDVGDHIILREIQSFWFDQLPKLPGNRPWTPMLLQWVLRFFGKELGARTVIAMRSQSAETLHTMLVKWDSPIQDFGDVVVAYLIDTEVEKRRFEAEELRLLLVDAGILRGNELIYNMPKALSGDERFAWDVAGSQVAVKV